MYLLKTNFDIENNNQEIKKNINDFNVFKEIKDDIIIINDKNLMGYIPFLKSIKKYNEANNEKKVGVISYFDEKTQKNYFALNQNGLNEMLYSLNHDSEIKETTNVSTNINDLKNKEIKYSVLDDFKLGKFMTNYLNQNKKELLNFKNFNQYLEDKLNQYLNQNNLLNLKTQYIERLKKELEVFNYGNALKENFIPYMLLVEDIVDIAKKNDILVGPGRGSGAGCLTAFLMNITKIDPIKYDLSFERFLNANRANFPDFDIDFDSRKLKKLKKLIKENGYEILAMRTFMSASSIDIKFAIDDVIKNNKDNISIQEKYLKLKNAIIDELNENSEYVLENLREVLENNLFLIESEINPELKKDISLINNYKKVFIEEFSKKNSINNIFNELYKNNGEKSILDKFKNELLKRINDDEKIKNFVKNFQFEITDIFNEIINEYKVKLIKENNINLIKIVNTLENYKTKSIHASGNIILSKEQLEEVSKIIQIETEIDKEGEEIKVVSTPPQIVEEMGLLKFDLLGLKTLSIIELTNEINKSKIEISKERNKIEVEKTIKMLTEKELSTIFQLNSPEMKIAIKITAEKLMKDKNLDIIEELANTIAFVRPGPMKNGSTLNYLKGNYSDFMKNYKTEGSKIENFKKDLKEILFSTKGQIVYQEQVMKIAELVGMTPIDSDNFRRSISKKDLSKINDQRIKFINDGLDKYENNQNNKIYFEKLFDNLASFAEYGFNKSHSVAYAELLWQTAFLLENYPDKFITANLKINSGEYSFSKNQGMLAKSIISAGEHNLELIPYYYKYDDINKILKDENKETILEDDKIILSSKIYGGKINKFKVVRESNVNINEENDFFSSPLSLYYNIGKELSSDKNLVTTDFLSGNSFEYRNDNKSKFTTYAYLHSVKDFNKNGKNYKILNFNDLYDKGESKSKKEYKLFLNEKNFNLVKSEKGFCKIKFSISKQNDKKFVNIEELNFINETPNLVRQQNIEDFFRKQKVSATKKPIKSRCLKDILEASL